MRLIDADTLEYQHEVYNYQTGYYTQAITMEQINNCQTIDNIQHGEWIYDRTGHYYCSNCHTMMSRLVSVYNYCYHCGSKNPPIPISKLE